MDQTKNNFLSNFLTTILSAIFQKNIKIIKIYLSSKNYFLIKTNDHKMIAIFFNQNSDKNKIANYKTFINFYETYKSNDEYIIINFNFENESNNYKEISENIVLINNDTKLFTFTEYKYFI